MGLCELAEFSTFTFNSASDLKLCAVFVTTTDFIEVTVIFAVVK